MDYHGPTRDGPRACLHDAPIDAICVECAREAVANFGRTALTAEDAIVALETLAECDQPARLTTPEGIVAVRKGKYGYDYYLAAEGDDVVVFTTRRICKGAVSRYRARLKRSAKARQEREPSLASMRREREA